MDRPSWDQYFIGMAHYASIRSHDSETKVGCVLVNIKNHVIGMGYNGFPQGCADDGLQSFSPYPQRSFSRGYGKTKNYSKSRIIMNIKIINF